VKEQAFVLYLMMQPARVAAAAAAAMLKRGIHEPGEFHDSS
jgi:hypothetical protein